MRFGLPRFGKNGKIKVLRGSCPLNILRLSSAELFQIKRGKCVANERINLRIEIRKLHNLGIYLHNLLNQIGDRCFNRSAVPGCRQFDLSSLILPIFPSLTVNGSNLTARRPRLIRDSLTPLILFEKDFREEKVDGNHFIVGSNPEEKRLCNLVQYAESSRFGRAVDFRIRGVNSFKLRETFNNFVV